MSRNDDCTSSADGVNAGIMAQPGGLCACNRLQKLIIQLFEQKSTARFAFGVFESSTPIMERKKKHIGLFVALGIAVAVFVADKVFSGGSPVGPEIADAAPTNESIETTGPAVGAVASDRETQAAEVRTSLAARLDKIHDKHRLDRVVVRDAFFPSAKWIAPVKSKAEVVEVKPEVDSVTLKARRFAQVHQLKGAIVAAGRSIAIIDGNCVSVGQRVDGFELKSVTASTAVLSCQGVEVVLNINAVSDDKSE